MAPPLVIIISFRRQAEFDREAQLVELTARLRSFLPPARADLIVVEQDDDGRPFNRGQLMNVGAWLALRDDPPAHLCFHDVDLLPCTDLEAAYLDGSDVPLHLAAQYARYAGPRYAGGITRVPARQFVLANGFPNNFWGWGGEDDALARRLRRVGPALACASGRVHDIERPIRGGAVLDRASKLRLLRGGGLMCPDCRELLAADGARWHVNGLASLDEPRVLSDTTDEHTRVRRVRVQLRGFQGGHAGARAARRAAPEGPRPGSGGGSRLGSIGARRRLAA
jgi:hypothetical protein